MNPSPPGSGASMEGTATAAKTASFAARRRPIVELRKMMIQIRRGCCWSVVVGWLFVRLLGMKQSKIVKTATIRSGERTEAAVTPAPHPQRERETGLFFGGRNR